MKCATHPEVDTNLACGSCGKPICPKCLVQTPVGARCPSCARAKRLPTYRVSTQQYFKAAGIGVSLAIVLGIIWGLLWRWLPYFLFNLFIGLILAAGIGYAIGELISLAVNRKRTISLQIVAGISFVLCYFVSNIQLSGGTLVLFLHFNLYDLAALVLGTFIAASRLR